MRPRVTVTPSEFAERARASFQHRCDAGLEHRLEVEERPQELIAAARRAEEGVPAAVLHEEYARHREGLALLAVDLNSADAVEQLATIEGRRRGRRS